MLAPSLTIINKIVMGLVAFAPTDNKISRLKISHGEHVSFRELEVLKRIAVGDTSHEIASRLFISHHTVLSHRKNLLLKLGAKNTAHLVMLGVRKGIL